MATSFRIRFFRRIQELMREVGTLLIAFAPLDVALQGNAGSARVLGFFLGLGLIFYGGSLALEWRLSRYDHE